MTYLKHLQICNQLVLCVFLPLAIYLGWWGWLGFTLAIYYAYGFFGITVGYHRLLAHRSFETYKPIELALTGVGILTALGSPLTNALVHRTHHGFSDRPRDPHSQHQHGLIDAWFGDWLDRPWVLDHRAIRTERKQRFYQITHDYYVLILLIYALGLSLIDWKLLVYGWCLPTALLFHLKGVFNTLGHGWGYRNHETPDRSRNSWLMNVLTAGDGWHNNHHAHPGHWNTQERWWEWDFAAWFIRLIKKE
jgi:stearoyl-CoA desaturase (delta-9 desaturase)